MTGLAVSAIDPITKLERLAQAPSAHELAVAVKEFRRLYPRSDSRLDSASVDVMQLISKTEEQQPLKLLEGAGELFSELLLVIRTIAEADLRDSAATAQTFARAARMTLLGLSRSDERGFQIGREIISQYGQELSTTWQMVLDAAQRSIDHNVALKSFLRCVETLRGIERNVFPELIKGDGPNIRMHLSFSF